MKVINVIKLSLGIILISQLTACSTWSYLYHKQDIVQNRDNNYLQSQNGQPLQMPAGCSNSQLGEDYPISGNAYPTNRQAVSEIPPGSLPDTLSQHPQSSASATH